jgi:hypothetical protein
MQAAVAGGRWLDAVESDLRRTVGPQVSAWLPELLATLVVETYAERADELAWRVRALERVDSAHLQARLAKAKLPTAHWFERLDSDVVALRDAALRNELARRLAQARELWPAATRPEDKSIVNSLCLSIAVNGADALELASDTKRFERLCGPAAPAAYAAVAHAVWSASPAAHVDAAQARKLFERLWRRDVAAEFAERVLAQIDAGLSRNGSGLAFVRAALSVPRGNGPGPQAWQELLSRMALKIAPRLKDAEFEALVALPQLDPRLREDLCSRRSFSLRGVHEKLGKLAHKLVGRFGKH